jgi:hypothetical protein
VSYLNFSGFLFLLLFAASAPLKQLSLYLALLDKVTALPKLNGRFCFAVQAVGAGAFPVAGA